MSKDPALSITAPELAALFRDAASILGSGDSVLSAGLGLIALAESLRARADQLQAATFRVLFVGPFGSGKSSLINAILGRPLLPRGVVPTTAVMTHVTYGETASVLVSERGRPAFEVTLDEFQEHFSLNSEGDLSARLAPVDHLVIRYPHPFLQKGITLIDTPGIGNRYGLPSHDALHLAIREADAIVPVIQPTGFGYDDIRFLRELIGVSDPLVIVVNKKSPDVSEHEIQNVSSKLVDLLAGLSERHSRDVLAERVVWVNALSALRGRVAEPSDDERVQQSGLPHLERKLEAARGRAWSARRANALRYLGTALSEADRAISVRGGLLQRKSGLTGQYSDKDRREDEKLAALYRRLRGIHARAFGSAPEWQRASSDPPRSEETPRSNTAAPPRLRVFLCHSSGDKKAVRELHERLIQEGVNPWLDEVDLIPGQHWEAEIRKVIKSVHIVIVCLSVSSINKAGFVQKEIKLALDFADQQPEGVIFIIPLRLEECAVPDRLSHLHWVDYFEERGFRNLLRALEARVESLGLSVDRDTSN